MIYRLRRGELDQKLNQPIPNEAKERELKKYNKLESQHLRLKRTKIRLADFRTVKVIGKGAFGEVRLVQKLDTGKVYAMKTLQKAEMLKRDQVRTCALSCTLGIWTSRFVLRSLHMLELNEIYSPSQHPHGSYSYIIRSRIQCIFTSLWNSFVSLEVRDAVRLRFSKYPSAGGDLMTMLMKYDIFSEDVSRFYMAECILAIEAVHKLGYIHRFVFFPSANLVFLTV